MIEGIKNVFSSSVARKKLFITFILLAIARLLVSLPAPGIDRSLIGVWANSSDMGFLGMMNIFTGGTMENISIGAVGITAYINASILIQLMTAVIPPLNDLTKQGREGIEKIKKITFIFSIIIAIFQATMFTIRFNNYGLLANGIVSGIIVVVSLTIGAMIVYGIGKLIDNKGIGDGVSFLIATNIASNLFSTIKAIYGMYVKGQPIAFGVLHSIIALIVILGIMYFIIFYNNGEKRIGVTYPGSNRYTNSKKTYLPIKPAMGGVMPPIMAVSLFSLLGSLPSIFEGMPVWLKCILNSFSSSYWFDFDGVNIFYTLGIILYVGMIMFCTKVYARIIFNPQEVADNLRTQGGMINGIRQDKMADEIERQCKNSLLIGGLGISLVMLLPIIISRLTNIYSLSIGGTSLIILVSVATSLSKKVVADARIDIDSKSSFRGKGRKLNVKTY